MSDEARPLKWQSGAITDGPSRAPARAMLRAVGFSAEDLRKPLVGVANTWIEIGPCNFHLRELAEGVKAGIRAAGGTPMEFNTVSISDGITMGSAGMRASLVSREVIADSIELVARGNMFDALVVLVGCDKTIPGAAMALARLNIPGVLLYGGSIAPGRFEGRDVTIQDVFEAVGAHAAGRMSDAALADLESHACPGAGACGGQFTANTMATACEFLGIASMGSGDVPAVDADKTAVARHAGTLVMDVLKRGLRPSQLITREALENAIAAVAASGGSTNAVLHLLAIAREAGVGLQLDDFDRISVRVPLLADLKPGGRFVAVDLHRAGGTRLLAARLQQAGVLHASAATVSGRTIGEEAAAAVETPNQEVIRPVSAPLKPTGGLVILRGNLAPDGCVVKVAGPRVRRPSRTGARLRRRGGGIRRRPGRPHPARRRRRHPPGRTEGRTRHARDACGDRRNHGGGPWRLGRDGDRRTILRGDARTDGRPRGARSGSRRTDRRRPRRRRDHARSEGPFAARRYRRGAARRSAAELDADPRTVCHGRDGEIRAAGVVGRRGRNNQSVAGRQARAVAARELEPAWTVETRTLR